MVPRFFHVPSVRHFAEGAGYIFKCNMYVRASLKSLCFLFLYTFTLHKGKTWKTAESATWRTYVATYFENSFFKIHVTLRVYTDIAYNVEFQRILMKIYPWNNFSGTLFWFNRGNDYIISVKDIIKTQTDEHVIFRIAKSLKRSINVQN